MKKRINSVVKLFVGVLATLILWDGLQGGMIEVATFKITGIVFWVDSVYHTLEGIGMALTPAFFYKKHVL